ncbi:AI-2E family transporter [Agrococcus sp. SGAir0287]|uniref:AI-2E family transporter n=1 Tax=Agrococcus sp. SGAir0287 TaxID=2070347 RepID=UPI0010CCC0A7|nr:AI-2E family transporter [Agrococcus sp. SGAir0287]QCR18997.1 AI-2E family transporter [Agrococcus sp. SGAir0287]
MRVKGAFQIGLLGGLGVLLAIAIAAAVGQVSSVLVYAFAAIFLALGIDPIVQFLTRHRFPRWLAVLTVIVVILGAFTGIVLIVVPVIVDQFSTLVQGIVRAFQDGLLEDVLDWAQQTFPGIDWQGMIDDTLSALQDPNTYASLPPQLGGIVTTIIGAIGATAAAIFGGFIVFVLMLYFMGSLPSLKSAMYRLVPASKRPTFIRIAEEIMTSIGRFVTGQFTLGLINGVLSFVMLSIVGSELAAVYAFIAFLASTIPLVGTITASVVISLLVLLLDGPATALPVAIYYAVYMQAEAYFISPQIMNRAVKVPGVVVVLAALTGGTLLGILGALVAIPVAAAIQLILKEVVIPRQDSL